MSKQPLSHLPPPPSAPLYRRPLLLSSALGVMLSGCVVDESDPYAPDMELIAPMPPPMPAPEDDFGMEGPELDMELPPMPPPMPAPEEDFGMEGPEADMEVIAPMPPPDEDLGLIELDMELPPMPPPDEDVGVVELDMELPPMPPPPMPPPDPEG